MNPPPEPPPTEVFSHVRAIVGIVIGLCISRLLNGVAQFLQHKRKRELYAIHLTWIAFTLLTVVHFWWFEFYLRGNPVWNFEIYMFVIYYAALHFLLAALLVPDNIYEYHDYREYFLSIRKYFFGLLAAFYLTDGVDTRIKGAEYFRSLGVEYPAQIFGFVILSLFAIKTRNRTFHTIFAIGALIYETSFVLRKFAVLS